MRAYPTIPLFVGNVREAEDLRTLRHLGVAAFVDLAVNELPVKVWREAVYCRFPIDDGGGNEAWMVRCAISATAQLIRARTKTLVFCSNGMSRSVAVAAGVHALVSGRSPEQCLYEAVTLGPADVSPIVWGAVVSAIQTLRLPQ